MVVYAQTKRRQPRTAARRSHVRASVRAALAASGAVGGRAAGPAGGRAAGLPAAPASALQELSARRSRAGIPTLSLFGDAHQLDYFPEDDEHGMSERASTAVAARPTSSILSAYRQVIAAAPCSLFYSTYEFTIVSNNDM